MAKIESKFRKATLNRIKANLPDNNKDVNAYVPIGIVSVIDSDISRDKLYKKFILSDQHYRVDSLSNRIAIATRYNTFKIDISDDIPAHTGYCLCDQDILYHFWIRSITDDNIQLIGSCCIQKFMDIKGKSCNNCRSSHNNRLSNYCSRCRVKCWEHETYHENNTICDRAVFCSIHHQRHDNNIDCMYTYDYYTIEFGKFKGELIKNVSKSYINWMSSLADKGILIERALRIYKSKD